VIGSFLNTFVKKQLLNMNTSEVSDKDWAKFMKLNWNISAVIIAAIVLMCFLFLSQEYILKKQQQSPIQPQQPQNTTSSSS
jgi:cytochrome c-type biogenesis protein CcmH/NrfG